MLEDAAWHTLQKADIQIEEGVDGLAFSLYEPTVLLGQLVPWLQSMGLCFLVGSLLTLVSVDLGVLVMVWATGAVLLFGLLMVAKELVMGGLRGKQHARVRLQLTQHALIWKGQRIPWSSVNDVQVARERQRYALVLTIDGAPQTILYQNEERLLKAFQALIVGISSIVESAPDDVPDALMALRAQSRSAAAQQNG